MSKKLAKLKNLENNYMRAKEFLYEDYADRLASDLDNLLIGAKGSGATSIQTQALVDRMQNMGYSVDINNIMSMLQANPNVMSATPQQISLTSEDDTSVDDQDDSANRVSDMAQKASKLG